MRLSAMSREDIEEKIKDLEKSVEEWKKFLETGSAIAILLAKSRIKHNNEKIELLRNELNKGAKSSN